MSTYPGTIDVFTNPAGTNTLDDPDHAGQHSDVNDAVEALEAAVGTTSGTGVLTDFTAGDLPVRQDTSNVLQDTIANGTATALTIGTATIDQAVAGSAVLDEDTMASDSATALATQQSIKAYIDRGLQARSYAYLGTTQENLTSGSFTKVLLDTEKFDVGSNFDTANNRFVAPVTGYYQVNAQIQYLTGSVVANKLYMVVIYVNGGAYSQAYNQAAYAETLTVVISTVVYATAGQYIELYARQISGVDTVDVALGAAATFMTIHLLGT